MKISFILPGRGRSGGIRVTVEMANILLNRGHDIRILTWNGSDGLMARLMKTAKSKITDVLYESTDWMNEYKGQDERFDRLQDVSFENGEVAIAVGSTHIPELLAIDEPIYKLHYCHGLPGDTSSQLYANLKYPIDCIAVSDSIAPTLEAESGRKVIDIVPNGIKADEYFLEERFPRDGVGLIFAGQYEKAPKETLEILSFLKEARPERPFYVFGKERRPEPLSSQQYWRFPTVTKARGLYNRCKVWMVTSRNEGFSLPVLEAMVCGCVVVSSKHDNATGLISHEKNGFLVDFADKEAYLHYIDMIFNDPALAEQIVEESQKTVAQYRWDRAADKLEEVLTSWVHQQESGK
ncbi:MAG: glycosyltransferase family 4 protein [Planctomycetota bacterium]|jgi:glycosyltransferase involved in cell wall biosynthesis